MPVARGVAVAGVLAAATLGILPASAHMAADADAFPPLVLSVADLTGDGVGDLAVGQPRIEDPLTWRVTVLGGATGRTVWQDDVAKYQAFEPLAGANGFAVAQQFTDGPADLYGESLRVRAVGGDGTLLWERTFSATRVVPSPAPTYVRSRFAGIVPGGVLVQTDTRIEAGATRLTRTTATLLGDETGEPFAEIGPIETNDDAVQVLPLPGGVGALTSPVQPGRLGDGTLRAYDTAGSSRWTASVRASTGSTVTSLPDRGLLSLSDWTGGVQLLDAATGEAVVDRQPGGSVHRASAASVRSAWFSEDGQPNGYTVELVGLDGRAGRRTFFPVGRETTFTEVLKGMDEVGDVDGDGWRDLLAHNGFTTPGSGTAYDDRLIDGRTLRSVPIGQDVYGLLWEGQRAAAVDGHGDDLVSVSGRTATVLDGATRTPLIRVTATDRIGFLVAATDSARCADVFAVTFVTGGVEAARVSPSGGVRWSTRRGAIRARDVSGVPRCAAHPDARGRTTPATGGLPAAGVAAAAVLGACVLRRGVRA